MCPRTAVCFRSVVTANFGAKLLGMATGRPCDASVPSTTAMVFLGTGEPLLAPVGPTKAADTTNETAPPITRPVRLIR